MRMFASRTRQITAPAPHRSILDVRYLENDICGSLVICCQHPVVWMPVVVGLFCCVNDEIVFFLK